MKLFNGNYVLDTFSNVPEAKERYVDTFMMCISSAFGRSMMAATYDNMRSIVCFMLAKL